MKRKNRSTNTGAQSPTQPRILPFRQALDIPLQEIHAQLAEAILDFPHRERHHAILHPHFERSLAQYSSSAHIHPDDPTIFQWKRMMQEMVRESARLKHALATPERTRVFLRRTLQRTIRETIAFDKKQWGEKQSTDVPFVVGEILFDATPAELNERVIIAHHALGQWYGLRDHARNLNIRLSASDQSFLNRKIRVIKQAFLVLAKPVSSAQKKWYCAYVLANAPKKTTDVPTRPPHPDA